MVSRKNRIGVYLATTLVCVVVSELVSVSFARNFPFENFRILYLLAFVEPVFCCITVVACFLFLYGIYIKRRQDLRRQNRELVLAKKARAELASLIRICPVCKNVRDDEGRWNKLEIYVQMHSRAFFSHGICPECVKGGALSDG